MEFSEKLQALRKQKGLTQEQLAKELYVSRTAISKWESGRGYPNIDSLKEIAKFFSVTVDRLLSGEEVLTIAREDQKRKESYLRDLVFGIMDISLVIFLFLPIFGQKVNDAVQEVSLLALTETAPYIKIAYFAIVITTVLVGIMTLALQNCGGFWIRLKSKLSLTFSIVGVLLFILSRQPYAAALVFVFLTIKAVTFVKKQ